MMTSDKSITQKEIDLINEIKNLDSYNLALGSLEAEESFVRAGEWQLAIEFISSNLNEFNFPITRDIYKRILDIANELQMDKSSLGLDNLIVID